MFKRVGKLALDKAKRKTGPRKKRPKKYVSVMDKQYVEGEEDGDEDETRDFDEDEDEGK